MGVGGEFRSNDIRGLPDRASRRTLDGCDRSSDRRADVELAQLLKQGREFGGQ